MRDNLVKFVRPVNGICVEQRLVNGFVNGTAMSTAYAKDIAQWLMNSSTIELINALASKLGKKAYDLNHWNSNDSSATRLSELFPDILTSKRGSPKFGGGVWLHPKLAVHLAQWCSPEFALLVSDWIQEWLSAGRNPLQVDIDDQYKAWQQRYDVRVFIKDFLRPELMESVVRWALTHGKNPIKLCAAVHDAMNERIQGLKSQDVKVLNGLPLGALIRDYFDASPLVSYAAINKLAKNAIDDRGIEPVQAVHEACDSYLGVNYAPKPTPIAENLYAQGQRLRQTRRLRRIAQGEQLNLWDSSHASY